MKPGVICAKLSHFRMLVFLCLGKPSRKCVWCRFGGGPDGGSRRTYIIDYVLWSVVGVCLWSAGVTHHTRDSHTFTTIPRSCSEDTSSILHVWGKTCKKCKGNHRSVRCCQGHDHWWYYCQYQQNAGHIITVSISAMLQIELKSQMTTESQHKTITVKCHRKEHRIG